MNEAIERFSSCSQHRKRLPVFRDFHALRRTTVGRQRAFEVR